MMNRRLSCRDFRSGRTGKSMGGLMEKLEEYDLYNYTEQESGADI